MLPLGIRSEPSFRLQCAYFEELISDATWNLSRSSICRMLGHISPPLCLHLRAISSFENEKDFSDPLPSM